MAVMWWIPSSCIVSLPRKTDCMRNYSSRRAAASIRPGPVAMAEQARHRRQASEDQRLDDQVAREPRQLRELDRGVAQARERLQVGALVLRQRAVAPGVAPAAAQHGHQQQRERHADRREAVVHEQATAAADARAPAREVVVRRTEAVRAVDVEHVEGAADLAEGLRGAPPDMPDAARDARRLEVRAKAPRILLAELRSRGELLRPAVRAEVRVDRDELGPRRRGRREDDRRAAAEGPDLHHPAAGRQRSGGGEEPAALRLRHPALDVAGGGPGDLEGRAAAHDAAGDAWTTRRARRPMASMPAATTAWIPSTIAAKAVTPR